jgi:hypothetical protein
MIAGTRAMLGAGAALLLADVFNSREQRRAVGWTLLSIGAITTIPILLQLRKSMSESSGSSYSPSHYREPEYAR